MCRVCQWLILRQSTKREIERVQRQTDWRLLTKDNADNPRIGQELSRRPAGCQGAGVEQWGCCQGVWGERAGAARVSGGDPTGGTPAPALWGHPPCMHPVEIPNPRSPISNQDELVHCKLIPLWTHLLHLTHVFVFAAGFIFLVKSFF